jgi:hypothetical protein
MNRNNLTTAVIAGIAGVAGIANMASAVNLNPDGLGQVLLYPYYTVNAHQQTLLSVVNTTAVGKAVKVRFLEGYNSREVLDFNLFLSKFDVWTANVFALSDGGVGTAGTGDAAGIFTTDNSCTAPAFTTTGLSNGVGYQAFLPYAFTGNNSDTGPTTNDRTREGHFEMIQMSDITGVSLSTKITHVNGVPPGCATAEALFDTDPTQTVPPTGGLFGAAAVVNTANGTFYTFNADALDGFTGSKLNNTTGSLLPNLANVNDVSGLAATAFVFNNGNLVTATYPVGSIDAVSAVIDASNVYNEYEHTTSGSIGTDWVVNFPTKRFYVDPAFIPADVKGNPLVQAPFEQFFGQIADGLSCDVVGLGIFDREERTTSTPSCGFSPCPPGQPNSSLCHETNILTFGGPSILGSNLTSNVASPDAAGWLQLSFTDAAHGGLAATGHPHPMGLAGTVANPQTVNAEGTVFYGLPVTGFEATDFVTSNAGSVLGNYSGVYRHRISRCTDTTINAAACS